MSAEETGTPAFPRIGHVHSQDCDPEQWIPGAPGMTLRDYFAAKAMQAILASPNAPSTVDTVDVAHDAYVMADDMLKAREQ